MNKIRQPAVAGMFYPAEQQSLRKEIHLYLDDVDTSLPQTPKAIIVPHAGYIYSGPVAASAYKQIIPLKDIIKRVVILGPAHRVAFQGLAVPEAEVFRTPLGNIPIDIEAVESISSLPQVIASDQAHLEEHSLEVQLPFLQEVLHDFSLLPLVVGEAQPDEVADVLNKLWGGEETLIVISTDLSHYHEYSAAKQIDSNTSNAIVHLQADRIGYHDACGRNGLNGLITVARQKGLSIDVIDLRNSGDTAGDKNRVVGYGAYVLH